MDTKKVFLKIKTQFPELEVYQNHLLAPYTTVKIGGPADIFIHSKKSEELINFLSFYNKTLNGLNIPITILGNGSNTLISDSGISGIVIKNSSQEISLISKNKIKVDSGVFLSSLITFSLNNQLIGLEEFAYIPSTIGGAIFGNIHGFDKHDFNYFLESVEVFDPKNNQLSYYSADQFKWSYDYSSFQDQTDLIIISAIINLQTGDVKAAREKYQEIIQKKSAIQPIKSLGSVFKNPQESLCLPLWGEKKAAGWIIDNELHLKGQSSGHAQISPSHANFIVNNDKATAKDYYTLIQLIQSKIKSAFGFQLELEIKLLGNFDH